MRLFQPRLPGEYTTCEELMVLMLLNEGVEKKKEKWSVGNHQRMCSLERIDHRESEVRGKGAPVMKENADFVVIFLLQSASGE